MRNEVLLYIEVQFLPLWQLTMVDIAMHFVILVPRPSPALVFDHLQYAKTEPDHVVRFTRPSDSVFAYYK